MGGPDTSAGASMGCLDEMKRVFCMLFTDTEWMVRHADEFHSAYYGSSSQSTMLWAWDVLIPL